MNFDKELLKFVLFETVLVTEFPITGTKVIPVAYHPFLVGPRSITYSDNSRTQNKKMLYSNHSNKAGRQPLRCTLTGSFGQKDRFMPTGGFVSGFERLKQFWDEVVRLGDTISKNEVEELLKLTSVNAPVWKSMELPSIFEESSSFFEVNFFDFINSRRFRCKIDFRMDETFSQNNLPQYTLNITELGPVVQADFFVDKAIEELFEVDQIAGSVLNRIGTVQPQNWQNLYSNIAVFGRTIVGDISDTITEFTTSANIDDIAAAASGYPIDPNEYSKTGSINNETVTNENLLGNPYSNPTIQNINDRLSNLIDKVEELYSKMIDQKTHSESIPIVTGDDPLENPIDYPNTIFDILLSQQDYEELSKIYKYGALTEAEYFDRLGAIEKNEDIRKNPLHSITHEIKENESIIDISDLYNVAVDDILQYNSIYPDDIENMFSISIPIYDSSIIPKIESLPVFGSHRAYNALGNDIPNALSVVDGELKILSNTETIQQDIGNTIDDFLEDLSLFEKAIPENIYPAYIEEKLKSTILQDPRIVGVLSFDIREDDTSFLIETELEAITRQRINISE